MAKRKFGPSGGGISDDYWDYMQRIKIPPIRFPDELSTNEFLKALEDQIKPEPEEMTTEFFMHLLKDPLSQQRRKRRTQRERILAQLEYYQDQEENWWIWQQMRILQFIDERRHHEKLSIWNYWRKQIFLPKFVKNSKAAYRKLLKEMPKKAEAFAHFAWQLYQYFKEEITPRNKDGKVDEEILAVAYRMLATKPQRIKEGSMIFIRRIRQLTLEQEYVELRRFTRELAPIFKEDKEA